MSAKAVTASTAPIRLHLSFIALPCGELCRQCCLRLSFGLDVWRTTAASTAFRMRHAAHGFRLVAQGHDERFNVALDIIPDAGLLERPTMEIGWSSATIPSERDAFVWLDGA